MVCADSVLCPCNNRVAKKLGGEYKTDAFRFRGRDLSGTRLMDPKSTCRSVILLDCNMQISWKLQWKQDDYIVLGVKTDKENRYNCGCLITRVYSGSAVIAVS
jgi:hypothetical protein